MTSRRSGFTLLEIMIVVMIIGVMAAMSVPRISAQFETDSAILQRMFEQAGDLALSGTPIRFSIEHGISSARGVIVAEALQKREEPEDSLSVFLGTAGNKPVILEWQKLKMKSIPSTEGWKFSPEIINFYTDGSCSPARISFAPRGVSERDADEYVLTVTGYCAQFLKD